VGALHPAAAAVGVVVAAGAVSIATAVDVAAAVAEVVTSALLLAVLALVADGECVCEAVCESVGLSEDVEEDAGVSVAVELDDAVAEGVLEGVPEAERVFEREAAHGEGMARGGIRWQTCEGGGLLLLLRPHTHLCALTMAWRQQRRCYLLCASAYACRFPATMACSRVCQSLMECRCLYCCRRRWLQQLYSAWA
jgi:hypothetical protein